MCDDNAECNNTEGSYLCNCTVGYSGDGFNCTGLLIINPRCMPEGYCSCPVCLSVSLSICHSVSAYSRTMGNEAAHERHQRLHI